MLDRIIKGFKNNKETICVFSSLIFVVLLILGAFCFVKINTERIYNESLEYIKSEQWEKAKDKLSIISYYKDSKMLLKKANYYSIIEQGDNDFKNQKYNEAISKYLEAQKINYDNNEVSQKIKKVNNTRKEQKKIKEQKISQLKKSLRFEYDKIENRTWVYDKTTPYYENNNRIFLYMGQNDNTNWLRFKLTYAGNDWIFFDKIIFNIDGEKIRKDFGYFETTREVVHSGGIYESIDLPYNENESLIKKIINSRNTSIRFEGKNHYADKTLSQVQKKAMKNILEYYNLMESKD